MSFADLFDITNQDNPNFKIYPNIVNTPTIMADSCNITNIDVVELKANDIKTTSLVSNDIKTSELKTLNITSDLGYVDIRGDFLGDKKASIYDINALRSGAVILNNLSKNTTLSGTNIGVLSTLDLQTNNNIIGVQTLETKDIKNTGEVQTSDIKTNTVQTNTLSFTPNGAVNAPNTTINGDFLFNGVGSLFDVNLVKCGQIQLNNIVKNPSLGNVDIFVLDNLDFLNNKSLKNVNSINCINTVLTNEIKTTSITKIVNGLYFNIPFEMNERGVGGIYNIPTPPINTFGVFKGPFFGNSANSTIVAGYRIKYTLVVNSTSNAIITIFCRIGATGIGEMKISINKDVPNLLNFNLFLDVQSGTITTSELIYHATLDNIGDGVSSIDAGGLLSVTGLSNSTMQPIFFIRSNQADTTWTAQRREYTFLRVS